MLGDSAELGVADGVETASVGCLANSLLGDGCRVCEEVCMTAGEGIAVGLNALMWDDGVALGLARPALSRAGDGNALGNSGADDGARSGMVG
jgi:hypothetical protein